jgi:hypothetical protein
MTNTDAIVIFLVVEAAAAVVSSSTAYRPAVMALISKVSETACLQHQSLIIVYEPRMWRQRH